MRISVLRIKGTRPRSVVRDAALLAMSVGAVVVGAQLVRSPEGKKYVQWIGEGGIAAIGWFIVVIFAGGSFALLWLALRDTGALPILFAWRSNDRVRVGSVLRVLSGRMVPMMKGERVEVCNGPPLVVAPASGGASRSHPWLLRAPAGQVGLVTPYEPRPHFGQVVDWLTELGVDANAEDTRKS